MVTVYDKIKYKSFFFWIALINYKLSIISHIQEIDTNYLTLYGLEIPILREDQRRNKRRDGNVVFKA